MESKQKIMPEKVLFIFEDGGKSPTAKVRGEIYKELLKQNNLDVKFLSYRFARPYVLGKSKNKFIQLIVSYIGFNLFWIVIGKIFTFFYTKRILWICRNFDTIVLIKISSFNFIEKIKKKSKARLIYDQCDALWLPHFSNRYKDIQKTLMLVDSVTWDYKYTREFVQKFNSNIFHWKAASQVELFDKYRNEHELKKDKGKLIIGWVGSESSAYNLFSIWEALENVFIENLNLHFRILGVGTNKSLLPNFENVSYSTLSDYNTDQMVYEVLKMDIGLFPLFDVEDSRVRGFLKPLIYMAGEAAVIATPIGEVPELIKNGFNGMLASSTQEWIEKMNLLIKNHALRHRIAKEGLETVRRDYNLEKSLQGLLEAINNINPQRINDNVR